MPFQQMDIDERASSYSIYKHASEMMEELSTLTTEDIHVTSMIIGVILCLIGRKKENVTTADFTDSAGMDTSLPPNMRNVTEPAGPLAHTTQVPTVRKIEHPFTQKGHKGQSGKSHTSNHSSRDSYHHPNRGRGGTNRGRGSSYGRNDGHRYQEPHVHARSSQHNYYGGHHQEQHHLYRTPIHTYNRFSPLREEPYRNKSNTQYPYMKREYNQFDRSPYTYNHTYPDPPQHEYFPWELTGSKRRADTSEAPEGGGGPGKRKRQ